jgi:hypothetical protein
MSEITHLPVLTVLPGQVDLVMVGESTYTRRSVSQLLLSAAINQENSMQPKTPSAPAMFPDQMEKGELPATSLPPLAPEPPPAPRNRKVRRRMLFSRQRPGGHADPILQDTEARNKAAAELRAKAKKRATAKMKKLARRKARA